MSLDSLSVYLLSVLVLLLKYVAAISVQARERFRTRGFRYPEDAAHFRGAVAPDSELCQRAERLLRNDSESQPFYLILGLAFALQNPHPIVAASYFLGYASTRVAHAHWLLSPRQPHRNRAFALGLVLLVCLGGHVTWLSLVNAARLTPEFGSVEPDSAM